MVERNVHLQRYGMCLCASVSVIVCMYVCAGICVCTHVHV